MDTKTLLLTDILNCGYADLDMLDIVYSPLADEIYYGDSRTDLLQRAINDGNGFNGILYDLYTDITLAIKDRIENLVEEYESTLDEEGKATEETEYTTLSDDLIGDIVFKDDKFIGLTTEQLTIIKDKIEEMENSYPCCNYLDSHFQNDLDQTLDEEAGVDDNCKYLLEYWLK